MIRVPTGYARRSIQQAQAKQKSTAPKAKRSKTATGRAFQQVQAKKRGAPQAPAAKRRPQLNKNVASNIKRAEAGTRRAQKRGSSASPGQVVSQVRAKPKGNKPGARVPKPAPKAKRATGPRRGGGGRGGGTPRPGGRRRY